MLKVDSENPLELSPEKGIRAIQELLEKVEMRNSLYLDYILHACLISLQNFFDQ